MSDWFEQDYITRSTDMALQNFGYHPSTRFLRAKKKLEVNTGNEISLQVLILKKLTEGNYN